MNQVLCSEKVGWHTAREKHGTSRSSYDLFSKEGRNMRVLLTSKTTLFFGKELYLPTPLPGSHYPCQYKPTTWACQTLHTWRWHRVAWSSNGGSSKPCRLAQGLQAGSLKQRCSSRLLRLGAAQSQLLLGVGSSRHLLGLTAACKWQMAPTQIQAAQQKSVKILNGSFFRTWSFLAPGKIWADFVPRCFVWLWEKVLVIRQWAGSKLWRSDLILFFQQSS